MHNTITNNVLRRMSTPDFGEYTITTRRFRAIEQHLSSEMKGEAVILSLKNGKYYGVNTVGAHIWRATQSPNTLQEIQAGIMQEYEVDEATCQQEVLSFLKKMVGEELVEIIDEKTS